MHLTPSVTVGLDFHGGRFTVPPQHQDELDAEVASTEFENQSKTEPILWLYAYSCPCCLNQQTLKP